MIFKILFKQKLKTYQILFVQGNLKEKQLKGFSNIKEKSKINLVIFFLKTLFSTDYINFLTLNKLS